jgi:hypothetical protein
MLFLLTGSIMYGFQVEKWSSGNVVLIITTTYGVLLSFISHLFGERYRPVRWAVALIWLVFVLAFFGLYQYWNSIITHDNFNICSAVTFSGSLLSLVLVISVLPYIKKQDTDQTLLTYNRKLFTALVITALLSLVMYGGLALAILAIDQLFNISVSGKVYAHLFVFIGGVVWSYLLLGKVPDNFDEASTETYPLFKVLVQYISIPIVAVYALILLFYALKNVIWPEGQEEWTLWLILWFYVLSFLVFCLNYSIKEAPGDSWSDWFCKYYLWASLPISILNLVSSWMIISNNGVTELTFIIATFSLFLLITAIYLLFYRNKDFKYIPLLLLFLVVLSVFGPWNMCRSTVRNQKEMLYDLMTTAGMVNDAGFTLKENISSEDQPGIIDKLSLLENRGQLGLLKLWDKSNILGDKELVIEEVLTALHLTNNRPSDWKSNIIHGDQYFDIDIMDYEKIVPVIPGYIDDKINGVYIKYSDRKPILTIYQNGQSLGTLDYSSSFDIEKIREEKYILVRNDTYEVKLFFKFLDINEQNIITNIDGMALFKSL